MVGSYVLSTHTGLSAEDNTFEYGIIEPITNNNLRDCYKFQSKEEFEYFFYLEYPLEIFGHGGLSYSTAISDLNNIIKNSIVGITIYTIIIISCIIV